MLVGTGKSNLKQTSNAGGTGALEDEIIEDEYIINFSDEADDSYFLNEDN
jgi:hypothetical protein